jgi:hypothetical protein
MRLRQLFIKYKKSSLFIKLITINLLFSFLSLLSSSFFHFFSLNYSWFYVGFFCDHMPLSESNYMRYFFGIFFDRFLSNIMFDFFTYICIFFTFQIFSFCVILFLLYLSVGGTFLDYTRTSIVRNILFALIFFNSLFFFFGLYKILILFLNFAHFLIFFIKII